MACDDVWMRSMVLRTLVLVMSPMTAVKARAKTTNPSVNFMVMGKDGRPCGDCDGDACSDVCRSVRPPAVKPRHLTTLCGAAFSYFSRPFWPVFRALGHSHSKQGIHMNSLICNCRLVYSWNEFNTGLNMILILIL